MNHFKNIVLLSSLAFSMGSHASLLVGAQVGPSFFKPALSGSANSGVGSKAQVGYSLGGYIGSSFLKLWGTEVGASIDQRKYEISPPSTKLSYKALVVDGLLRAYLPFVSLGAGPFLSSPMGNKESRVSGLDFGLMGSLRGVIEMAPTLGFSIDARYLMGLRDTDKAGSKSSRTNEFQFLAGIEFSIL